MELSKLFLIQNRYVSFCLIPFEYYTLFKSCQKITEKTNQSENKRHSCCLLKTTHWKALFSGMRFGFISLLRFAVLPKPDRCNELGGSSIFKTMASTTSTKYVLPGFCILFCYALRKKEDMGAVSTTASMASMASNMAQYFPCPNLKSHFRVSRCRLFAKKNG